MSNVQYEDLSRQHQLAGNIFCLPSTSEDCRPYRLSSEQVDFYSENGYVAGVRILSEEQVEALLNEVTAIMDPAHPAHSLFYEFHSNESPDPARVLFHALGAWRITPGLHDILWHPAVTVPASQLLEGPVRFWHDQLFCKPSRHGGVVAWHQDYSYWTRTKPMAHLTCWIGLDDSTKENGCLQYVPGSHRWDLLPITGLTGDMESIRKVLTEDQAERLMNPVAIELKKGECSFHHPMMIHGSFENSTDRQRRAVVLNMVRDGVKSASDEPLLQGVPPIPCGSKLEGQFFPLLFDPDKLA